MWRFFDLLIVNRSDTVGRFSYSQESWRSFARYFVKHSDVAGGISCGLNKSVAFNPNNLLVFNLNSKFPIFSFKVNLYVLIFFYVYVYLLLPIRRGRAHCAATVYCEISHNTTVDSFI